MNLHTAIEELEKQLTELRATAERGYQVFEESGYENYEMRDDHEAVYDAEGNLAGIVINQKVMTKYFESRPYK